MVDETAFIGWHRSGSTAPWQALVQASTYALALGKLLDLARGGDLVVLPAGKLPDPPDRPPIKSR